MQVLQTNADFEPIAIYAFQLARADLNETLIDKARRSKRRPILIGKCQFELVQAKLGWLFLAVSFDKPPLQGLGLLHSLASLNREKAVKVVAEQIDTPVKGMVDIHSS